VISNAAAKTTRSSAIASLHPPLRIPNTFEAAIPELQLLRAAGCCLVFLAHVMVLVYPERFLHSVEAPAGELFARAVIGFFILSGLVLSLPYVGETKQPFHIRRFYFDRLMRLYPAYLVSLFFALGLRFAIAHSVGLTNVSPWAQRFWSQPLSTATIVEHILAVAIHTRNINPVLWTLSLEIQACLLLPVIIFVVRRTPHWSLSFLPIVALTVLSHFFPLILVLKVLGYFFMGAYIARYNTNLKAVLGGLPNAAVLAFAILVYAFFWIAPQNSISYRLSFLVLDGLLALSMVAIQACRPLAPLAKLRPVQRFAELTYCFYLVHLPILAACAIALRPIVHSASLTILAALSLTLAVAAALHEWIEQPMRSFAKSRRRVAEPGRLPIGELAIRADAVTTSQTSA
jgi:peptidoglycan/LPS O-acetylase OafA/YrhL